MLRINYDGRGESLGMFQGEDLILVITKDGEFFTSTYADSNHYEDNILKIEKFDPDKIWTLALFDSSLGFPYLKRFRFEPSSKPQRFVGSEPDSRILLLSDTPYARLEVTFGGADSVRPPLEIETDDFISVKSFKAKGKRISTYTVDSIIELEPTRFPEPATLPDDPDDSVPASPKVLQGDLFAFEDDDSSTYPDPTDNE